MPPKPFIIYYSSSYYFIFQHFSRYLYHRGYFSTLRIDFANLWREADLFSYITGGQIYEIVGVKYFSIFTSFQNNVPTAFVFLFFFHTAVLFSLIPQRDEGWQEENGFNGEEVNLCTLAALSGPDSCNPVATSINIEVADDTVSSVK